MNKTLKKILIGIGVVIILASVLFVVWAFLISPKLQKKNNPAQGEMPTEFKTIAEENENIDFNEENGLIYVNSEIVVVATTDASQSDIEALAKKQEASLDDAMKDIGIYRFIYSDAMTYEELDKKIEKIKKNKYVEDAYYNVVSIFEADAAGDKDFKEKDPVFPEENWDGDTWNVSVPRGNNWGMEAIDAPGAWGYLDQMKRVRVGMIDTFPNASHPDLDFSNTTCLFSDEKGLTSTNTMQVSPGYHGCHVAGIMAARWNNEGVAGVMGDKGDMYSCSFFDSKGESIYGTAYTYLLSIKTLIDQDVQVINISQNTNRLTGFAASRNNENAINYLKRQADLAEKGLSRIIADRKAAEKKDFVICVAAGNSNDTEYYKDDNQPFGYREEKTPWEIVKSIFGWRGEMGDSLAIYNNFLNLMTDEEVKSRVIVVGAIGIDFSSSNDGQTRYCYTDYSCVGSRVDVVAPGACSNRDAIYSCLDDGYGGLCGTSMATPHVAGVAGLIFACNPSLSGPEVKEIILASTVGRYYYYDGYSGLINANMAVVNALQTQKKPVERVIKRDQSGGLDLCFVVDTTGSMGDDIDNAKENMTEILSHLSDKTPDYRVALIDYRDFASRTRADEDYPYKVQLRFTDNNSSIQNAINALELGNGGDTKETVYSGLMAAVRLDWRSEAKKVIIVLGDAAPLDPEPETGYTYEDVLVALFNSSIAIDMDDSDSRVTDSFDESLINVYTIGTDAGSDAVEFFENIAEETGGRFSDVDDASQVGDAIIESIDQIEVVKLVSVNADFGDSLSDKQIDIYQDKAYLFSIETDETGTFKLDSMEVGEYEWKCPEAFVSGSFDIGENEKVISVNTSKQYWFTPVIENWNENKAKYIIFTVLIILLIVFIPLLFTVAITKLVRHGKKKKQLRQVAQTAVCCPRCGTPLSYNTQFCGKCGAKINWQ